MARNSLQGQVKYPARLERESRILGSFTQQTHDVVSVVFAEALLLKFECVLFRRVEANMRHRRSHQLQHGARSLWRGLQATRSNGFESNTPACHKCNDPGCVGDADLVFEHGRRNIVSCKLLKAWTV